VRNALEWETSPARSGPNALRVWNFSEAVMLSTCCGPGPSHTASRVFVARMAIGCYIPLSVCIWAHPCWMRSFYFFQHGLGCSNLRNSPIVNRNNRLSSIPSNVYRVPAWGQTCWEKLGKHILLRAASRCP
jgi:hypothetical protein